MIKGIYNENEFYTNFYWDTKLLEDMRSKAPARAEEKVNQLKALDSLFWKLKETAGSHGANQGQQIEFYNLLFRILGFQPVQESTQTSESGYYTRFLNENKGSNPELIGILTSEIETGSFEAAPLYLSDKIEGEQSIFELDLKELLREELLDSQAPPRWVLVGSPNSLFVIERTKWAIGRYIRIEWQEVFLQRDSKPYELILGLCSKSALCPDIGSSSHDEFDDNSHRHAFEVTTELRESVREAIEALINELIDLRKESHQKIYAKESSDLYAKELTHDALYYVYRLLFLLYLEAQGEDSDLLPLKSEIYRNGYSLEKLLELDFVEVAPDSTEAKGTFIFESLEQIFNLIFYGFEPGVRDGLLKSDLSATGFLVKGIKSDLFDPCVMRHLRGVKLSNGALLDILKKLSLTRKKERGNKARARVSYANLGINQLGAVYEGLLSYTGFFAQEDLHALKPANVKQTDLEKGKELDQVYLAPKSLVDKHRRTREEKYRLTDENLVLDSDGNPKIYKKGSFIYRLAGRDRQRLASYYTPESLTKCTVKHALKVLHESRFTLTDLWKVRILEPAMGSGAFLNEAVNQLAEMILELEVENSQKELSSPRAKQKRLFAIKYRLISENVYGVDLNPMAVELARFSLWLNCMGSGQEPPSFSKSLKIGNSLIGARFNKNADGIFRWLTISPGMFEVGARLKEYDAATAEKLAEIRKIYLASSSNLNEQIKGVQGKAECIYSRFLGASSPQEKETYYSRLKLCCDFYCALFFVEASSLPSLPQDYSALLRDFEFILDGETEKVPQTLLQFVRNKESENRFFHWELEFSEIINGGGFDLVLGNPPWVPLNWQAALEISDLNPIPSVLELNAAKTREFIGLNNPELFSKVLAKAFISFSAVNSLLATYPYDVLIGSAPNTYKNFAILSTEFLASNGAAGLIYEDGLFEEAGASDARKFLYSRLRYHFQFWNQKLLFADVGNTKSYSVNILSDPRQTPHFFHIGNLFLPITIDQCFDTGSEQALIPGMKNEKGDWEIKGHPDRVIEVDSALLSVFAEFSSDKVNPTFLNLHSAPLASFLGTIRNCQTTFQTLAGKDNVIGGRLFDETMSQDDLSISADNKRATSLDNVVLSGPNISLGNFLFQETLEEYNSHRSYLPIASELYRTGYIPRTLYSTKLSRQKIRAQFPRMTLSSGHLIDMYRMITRRRIDSTNERCFFTCIIPPGVSYINTMESIGFVDPFYLMLTVGCCSSLALESLVRLKNLEDLYASDILGLPAPVNAQYFESIARRTLRLNSVHPIFQALYDSIADRISNSLDLTITGWQVLPPTWSREIPLTSIADRLQLQCELDALVGLAYGVDSKTLGTLYTQLFPVMEKYDRKDGVRRVDLISSAYDQFKARGW